MDRVASGWSPADLAAAAGIDHAAVACLEGGSEFDPGKVRRLQCTFRANLITFRRAGDRASVSYLPDENLAH